ncbi:MAG: 2,3-diphosphoglycerate-dependent phosphoglycerate mutase [Hyphomicrobium sp.]|jgi:2,3-bisphosphoglycerate-dependent phosphoglycerate mutase
MPRLILLRHGESVWNRDNRFTGWIDVDLSTEGVEEAHRAAALIKERDLRPDWCCTSYLKRAIRTLWIVLDDLDRMWLPVDKSWRLNERHYGALEGLKKAELANELGAEQVRIWRRSFDIRPPALEESDARFPGCDARYASLPDADVPRTESLKDTLARVLPYWTDVLSPQLRAGRCVLVSGHGNTFRALVKHLDQISDEVISNLEIPTGVPLVYELDAALRPLERHYVEPA